MDTKLSKPLTVEEAASLHALRNEGSIYEEKAINHFKAGAVWREQQGTIRWFEIAKDGLPVKPEHIDRFFPVLVLLPTGGKNVAEVVNYDSLVQTFERKGSMTTLYPTHYAYINY